jgi:hypothetical protein
MATVNENVQYTLTLKDLLTGKLGDANAAAQQLEGTMGMLKKGLGLLGVGFAIFKGGEFVKESVEAFHQLEQANAQVQAGLISTKGAAGMTFEDVQKSAKGLAAELPYSRSALLEMQSILLTFPSVTKESFTPASQIIADMSTRLGQDLKSSAIQVGKALQDPIKGVTALRRVGVNFNEAQTEMIKKMVQGGHTAQAQAAIMKELQTEFGGSAKAAADADPMFRFNKMMGSFKMAVGEAGMELLTVLKPALESIGRMFVKLGEGIKSFIEYLKEHKELVQAIAIGVGVAIGVYGLYTLAVNAAAIATNIWTAAQWLLDAALDANPIGLVVVAIGAMVAAIVYAYEKVAWFRAGLWATWSVIKEFASIVGDIFAGLGTTIKGVLTFDPEMIAAGATQAISAVKNASERIGNAAKQGYEEGMKDFNKSKEEGKDKSKINKVGIVGAPGESGAAGKDISPKGAKGQQSTTINVSIGKLIESFKVSTITMKEGANQVEEMVANALLRSVNEFQVHTSV